MIPSIPIRIDNLLKAMEIVIAPSIEEDAVLAKEQAALLIKHLKIIGEQWDAGYLFERGSLEKMHNLADRLIQQADGGEGVKSAVLDMKRIVADTRNAQCDTAQEVTAELIKVGNGIEELINGCFKDGSIQFKNELLSAVMEYGEEQSYRERVWFKSTGMDPDADELGGVHDVLRKMES